MAKPRNRGSKPINTEYLGSFILARFRGSKSKFAEEAEVGRTTIYNALAGKPVDQLTIDRFCRADPALDYVRLTTIPDQVPQATVSSGDDTNSRPPTILTLASIKGGAGKTMIAVSIAAELATKLRVALVDVDVFTFGATRWFGELVRSAQSPLTFVDVALRADAAQSRSVLKTEVEQPIPAQSAGELLFVPAHCEVGDKTFGVAARPILVDWGIDDARDAVTQLVRRLTQQKVDVIVLDTHPGLMALTDVICREADCNILVSDCDLSTLQANWLFAWEVQFGRLGSDPPAAAGGAPIEWRIALNRIPSPATVDECRRLVRESRKSAYLSLPPEVAMPEEDPKATDPILLLPELEVMRLEDTQSHSPTSIKRRGGNQTVLAVKYLVRRLALEGVAPELESQFSYAAAGNEIAERRLSGYLENYAGPWQPGWRKLENQTILLLAAIFVLFLIDYVVWRNLPEDWPDEMILQAVVALVSGSIICLVFLVCARAVRQVILDCRRICWFIDACSIADLSADEQTRIYNAGVYPQLQLAGQSFMQLMLLVLLVPAAAFAGFSYPDLSPLWRTAIWIATGVVVAATLWNVPGRLCVLRVLNIGTSSTMPNILKKRRQSQ